MEEDSNEDWDSTCTTRGNAVWPSTTARLEQYSCWSCRSSASEHCDNCCYLVTFGKIRVNIFPILLSALEQKDFEFPRDKELGADSA